MYFFFHLATGIVLGLLIADLISDRRWVIPVAIGSVIPDLIDKPVGFILFPETIGYGRIFTHTLLVVAITVFLGLAFWKYKKSPALVAVALGILSHQLLDLMWRQKVNWLYPFLGPFKGKLPADYLFTLIMRELSNISEWLIFGAIVLAILLYLNFERKAGSAIPVPTLRGIMEAGSFALCITSGIVIGCGVTKRPLPYFGWTRPEEYWIGGLVFALAAFLLWRYQKHLAKNIGEKTG